MSRFRSILALVLLMLGAVLVPLSATAWWLRATVTDTGTYVATVTPLATDPAVVSVVERQLTDRIVAAVEQQNLLDRTAKALVAQGVPRLAAKTLALLSDPLLSRLDRLVGQTVDGLVESPAFATTWVAANRVAHTQLIKALNGDPDALVVSEGGMVNLDLSAVAAGIGAKLTAAGVPLLGKLPPITVMVPIAASADLKSVHTAYVVLRGAAVVLPIVAVLLLTGGVILARQRRRATLRVGFGVLAGCVLLVLGLAILRSSLTGSLAPSRQQAAVVVFDAVTGGLLGLVRLLVLVVAAGLVTACLAGSSESAVSSRRAVTVGYERGRSVLAASAFSRPVAVAVATGCLLTLLFTSGLGVALTALLVVVAVAAGTVTWLSGSKSARS